MKLTNEQIDEMVNQKRRGTIHAPLVCVLSIFAFVLVLIAVVAVISNYYGCKYDTADFWVKTVEIIVPALLGIAAIVFTIVETAPKVVFGIKEKDFELYNASKMKQKCDLLNKHGMPVNIKISIYYGKKGALSTDSINENEYRYADSKYVIKLPPNQGFVSGSFHVEGVTKFEGDDIIVACMEVSNFFVTIKDIYIAWYYDATKSVWVLDPFFRKFR